MRPKARKWLRSLCFFVRLRNAVPVRLRNAVPFRLRVIINAQHSLTLLKLVLVRSKRSKALRRSLHPARSYRGLLRCSLPCLMSALMADRTTAEQCSRKCACRVLPDMGSAANAVQGVRGVQDAQRQQKRLQDQLLTSEEAARAARDAAAQARRETAFLQAGTAEAQTEAAALRQKIASLHDEVRT